MAASRPYWCQRCPHARIDHNGDPADGPGCAISGCHCSGFEPGADLAEPKRGG